jgi:hypothetical protein
MRPWALSPTASEATTVRKFMLIASTTLARTQPLVVRSVTTSVSTALPVRTLPRCVPKKGRRLSLADHELACSRRQLADDLARVCAFREEPQARRFLAPESGVGAVFGLNDAGENDRKFPLAEKANSGAASAIASRMLPRPTVADRRSRRRSRQPATPAVSQIRSSGQTAAFDGFRRTSCLPSQISIVVRSGE